MMGSDIKRSAAVATGYSGTAKLAAVPPVKLTSLETPLGDGISDASNAINNLDGHHANPELTPVQYPVASQRRHNLVHGTKALVARSSRRIKKRTNISISLAVVKYVAHPSHVLCSAPAIETGLQFVIISFLCHKDDKAFVLPLDAPSLAG